MRWMVAWGKVLGVVRSPVGAGEFTDGHAFRERGAFEPCAELVGVEAPLVVEAVGVDGVHDVAWEMSDGCGFGCPGPAECVEDGAELVVGDLGRRAVDDGEVAVADVDHGVGDVVLAGEGGEPFDHIVGGAGEVDHAAGLAPAVG